MADLVNQIKEIQRKDAVGKAGWIKYCEDFGNAVRDPSKHDTDYLQYFINQYEAGEYAHLPPAEMQDSKHRGEGGGGGGGGPLGLAEGIKEGQRNSPCFKEAWATWQLRQGEKMNDPMKASKENIVAFLEFCGQNALGAMGAGMPMGGGGGGDWGGAGLAPQYAGKGADAGWGSGCGGWGGDMGGWGCGGGKGNDWGAPPMVPCKGGGKGGKGGDIYGGGKGDFKGGCDMGWGDMGGGCKGGYDKGGYDKGAGKGYDKGGDKGGKGGPQAKRPRVSTGNPELDELVEKIKNFQRSGDQQKEAWWSFADSSEGRNRDPARHDVAALQMFCGQYGVQ